MRQFHGVSQDDIWIRRQFFANLQAKIESRIRTEHHFRSKSINCSFEGIAYLAQTSAGLGYHFWCIDKADLQLNIVLHWNSLLIHLMH